MKKENNSKLTLENLKINSFATTSHIRGGGYDHSNDCGGSSYRSQGSTCFVNGC